MIKEIEGKFEVIQSCTAYENYSDGGGDGVPGISVTGVGNQRIVFILPKKIFDKELSDDWVSFCEIIELVYIANKLKIKEVISIFFLMPREGERIYKVPPSFVEEILQLNRQEIIKRILHKIEIIHQFGRKLFFQDRRTWTKDVWRDEDTDTEWVRFSRRLAIYVCDKDVTLE